MSRFQRKKKEKSQGGAPEWMITYSDMVTLVLVFFILLYSMSIIDVVKFQQFLASFQGTGILNWQAEPFETPPEPQHNNVLDEKTIQDMLNEDDQTKLEHDEDYSDIMEENPLVEVYNAVNSYIEEHNLGDVVEVRFEVRGIALEIKDQILFDSAKADLKPGAKEVLEKLAPLLKDLPYMTSVEGHTDNRPINTPQFPSNWELSAARALSVVRFFIDELNLEPQRFAVVGLGEYHPVVPNDGPDNWQLNRRVIIVINAENPFKSEVLDSGGTTETGS
jgi:chemotaxis protein MotB